TTVNLTPLNKDNQIKQSISNRPENLALDHINSGNTTTATVINNILSNQKVAITEKKLEELLGVKGIEFDLPITKDTQASFTAVIGKSVHSGGFAGVYVFTHIASNFKYVGSSNLLVRRMAYCFKDNLPQVGLLLPFITRYGLSAFKLNKIYKLD
ncbi:GIY endonuclease, partial [Tuber indicum]